MRLGSTCQLLRKVVMVPYQCCLIIVSRSQLLICLENYQGIVIFSTNLVENYDRGFETRMRHIHFPMPDNKARLRLWKNHLPAELPCDEDVNPEKLAELEGLCGRDIKNAVIDAALRSARKGSRKITQADLVMAIERLRESRIQRDESD